MPKYLELLLASTDWHLYFDNNKAKEKYKELKRKGKQAEIYRERDQITVFELINNN